MTTLISQYDFRGKKVPFLAGFLTTLEHFCSLPEGRGITCCGKTLTCCHPDRSEGSRPAAQGELREGSRSVFFQRNVRFFLRYAQGRLRLVRMTVSAGFSATCSAPPFRQAPIDRGRGCV